MRNVFMITTAIYLSIAVFSNVSAKEIVFSRDGKISKNTVIIDGCYIDAFYETSEGGYYFEKNRAHLSVIKCKANDILNGKATVKCISEGKQIKENSSANSDGYTSAFIFGLDAREKTNRAFSITESEKISNRLNMLSDSCKKEQYKTTESYPVGTIVRVSKHWANSDYGYTGEVVAVNKPNEIYSVMVRSIHHGASSQLNPVACTNDQFVEKYRDEGKIFTISSYCWTK